MFNLCEGIFKELNNYNNWIGLRSIFDNIEIMLKYYEIYCRNM
jgi:hypothetical protein